MVLLLILISVVQNLYKNKSANSQNLYCADLLSIFDIFGMVRKIGRTEREKIIVFRTQLIQWNCLVTDVK